MVKHKHADAYQAARRDLEIQILPNKEEVLQNSGECSNQTVNPHTVR